MAGPDPAQKEVLGASGWPQGHAPLCWDLQASHRVLAALHGSGKLQALCIVERPPPCLGLPAVALQLLGFVRAVEELPFEELHGNDGKDEHEQHVDDQDVEDVFQRVHHTVKHGLQEDGGV